MNDPHMRGDARHEPPASAPPPLPPLTEPLVTWLSLPTARLQRRFLASHLDAFDASTEQVLAIFSVHEHQTGRAQRAYKLADASALLREVRERGSSPAALQAAYLNWHGGLALDVPAWLEEIEREDAVLLQQEWTVITAKALYDLWQQAQARAWQQEPDLAPEILIELRLRPWWRMHALIDIDARELIAAGVPVLTDALMVYTRDRAPLRWAALQHALGDAYKFLPHGERSRNIAQALTHFDAALAVLSHERFPVRWAILQGCLGEAFRMGGPGAPVDNIEQAILHYQQALPILTEATFPTEWALLQYMLGDAYNNRFLGGHAANVEQALDYMNAALRVYTCEAHPVLWAECQSLVAALYTERLHGDRNANMELAIVAQEAAMTVKTREGFPHLWAEAQVVLGILYTSRLAGEPADNFARAIDHLQQSLSVLTHGNFPRRWAHVQETLARAYVRASAAHPEYLDSAVAHYHAALTVFTREAYPGMHRQVSIYLAVAEIKRGDWEQAHVAFAAADDAEQIIVALDVGEARRGIAMADGCNLHLYHSYVLVQLGDIAAAAVVIERRRARGLAESRMYDIADPQRIVNLARRQRYEERQARLVAAQADLYAPTTGALANRQREDQARVMAFRSAKAAFDVVVTEIQQTGDPPDFLYDTLTADTILHAAKVGGPGHALVYLAATPAGGVAVAALNEPDGHGHFATLKLPELTTALVTDLCDRRHGKQQDQIIGGFAWVQLGDAHKLLEQWPGQTLQTRAAALHAARLDNDGPPTLDMATQWLLTAAPESGKQRELDATLSHRFLQLEWQHCMEVLARVAMRPLVTWLQQEHHVTSMTLIPCEQLGIFPLASVLLDDEHTVGDVLPTSLAPSARSFLPAATTAVSREGIYTLGDPRPKQQPLPWSEAEAVALTRIAKREGLPAHVQVNGKATREWALHALAHGKVVHLACHGIFDSQDFLQARLLLAGQETLALRDVYAQQLRITGVRLVVLSACQTALIDLQGANDEVHSLTTGFIQAGAQAILSSWWMVDDQASYLLMTRFAQEWFPHMNQEPPAAALARAQRWLRQVTNAELRQWHITVHAKERENFPISPPGDFRRLSPLRSPQLVGMRGRGFRLDMPDAERKIHRSAQWNAPDACPYADPVYWAGFQVTGW